MTISIDEVICLLNADPETRLTELEEKILRLAWDGSTYGQMAIELHYQENYLRNIAKELWPVLTKIFGEPITKINFNSALRSLTLTPSQARIMGTVDFRDNVESIPEPYYGPIPLASSLYLDRPPLEDLACAEIRKSGAVVRIKAPAKMGKTSLLIRILHAGQSQGYRTVNLNLAQVDRDILNSDLSRFLRWLCNNTSRQLGLTPLLSEYWDEEVGAKVSCSAYFHDYLLSQSPSPLVLALDNAQQLFEYPHLIKDFFPLLRSWHEESKIVPIWQQLRLVIIYSHEIFLQQRLSQSPFNIGLPLNLSEFTRSQVLELAQRYGLNWFDASGQEKLTALMQMIGGHPHHLHLAFYHLRWLQADLETLLLTAPTPKGIYSDHLRYLSSVFQEQPELVIAWVRVIESATPVTLDAIAAYKLDSLGLIKWLPTGVVPRNDLYRLYFRQELSLSNYTTKNYILQLEQENQRLWELCFIDELTGLGNQAGFERNLANEWRRSARTSGSLSMIFCEIDNFDTYEDLGNSSACLEILVKILTESARRAADYLARYQGSQFAILLPDTNREGTQNVAEKIKARLEQISSIIPKITVSMGGFSSRANFQINPDSLILSAQQALQQAQAAGGNQIIIGE